MYTVLIFLCAGSFLIKLPCNTQSHDYTNFIICIGPTYNLIKTEKVVLAGPALPGLCRSPATSPAAPSPARCAPEPCQAGSSGSQHCPVLAASWKLPPLAHSPRGSAGTVHSTWPAHPKHPLGNYWTCWPYTTSFWNL